MVLNPLTYGKTCTVPPIKGEPALQIAGLTFHYPGVERAILKDVSLCIERGERVALIGPNGAGKSTLIKLIAGLLPSPSAKEITIYGNPVGACYHRVGYVPQRSEVDWQAPVSVREVVMMGRYVHLGWMRWPRKADHQAVEQALATLDLLDLADRQIGDLSGGQQQRVMLARTLAQDAELLLLDEPMNNLDVISQEAIFHVLEKLAGQGRAIIVSLHDLGIIPTHFTRTIFLDAELIADGPVGDVLTAGMLSRAYGISLCIDGEED